MFGLGVVTGEFALRGGHVDVAASISDSAVHAVVDAASIDTGHPTRDRMVRSMTYLDVEWYPDLDFVADAVHSDGERWIVDGTLTAHGVPAPLRITVDAIDVAAGEVSLHAVARVDRYAHGIQAGRGITGRRLSIEIAAVATPELSTTTGGTAAVSPPRAPQETTGSPLQRRVA